MRLRRTIGPERSATPVSREERPAAQQPAAVMEGAAPPAAEPAHVVAAERPLPRGERSPAATSEVSPRRGLRWRTRDAGASAVGSMGAAIVALARLAMTVATLIVLLIALAVVLRDVDANGSNTIVKGIHEGANFFAGSFTGLITAHGHPKREITIDWGIAAVVYLVVGSIIAGAIARLGGRGLRFERTHRTVAAR